MYLIEQTQCAEATLPAVLATVVEQALHAQVGTCADQGYSMSEGSKTVTLPGGLGDVTLSLFKKASASLAIPSYGEDQPFPELGLQLGMVEQPTPDSGDHHQQHEHGHGQHHHHDHDDSDHHHQGYDGSDHRQHGHGHGHDDRQGTNAHGNAHGDCPFKKCFRLAKDLCHLSRHQHHEKIQCLKDHAAELPAECQLVVAYDAPVPSCSTHNIDPTLPSCLPQHALHSIQPTWKRARRLPPALPTGPVGVGSCMNATSLLHVHSSTAHRALVAAARTRTESDPEAVHSAAWSGRRPGGPPREPPRGSRSRTAAVPCLYPITQLLTG